MQALAGLGHATNAQLFALVGEELGLSLTSVHRITARLAERGEIGMVSTGSSEMIYDIRAEPHDHFSCTQCGGLLDVEIPQTAIDAIQHQLGTHLVNDGMVVRGRCAQCVLADPDQASYSPRRARAGY